MFQPLPFGCREVPGEQSRAQPAEGVGYGEHLGGFFSLSQSRSDLWQAMVL